jgi:poly(A) polymerase
VEARARARPGTRTSCPYNRRVEGSPGAAAPRILSRPEHIISRKNIDPDALRVLYRLKSSGFVAYLVGGGVRDLLLERQPKDFDIATSAHPQQVRKLFRNCFIVGRRFRLAHVRFGRKVIEVSTFRRASSPDEGDTLIRRDNTFGTPEEDAFRRDFTVNALFYDIANFSVIDWVNGLPDLEARVIRTIGDPAVRLREDPVRMLRAIALAARLGFTIDRDTAEAIRDLRGQIVLSSSARILEEFYKILRQGRSRETFEMLHEYGLLAYMLPQADRALASGGEALLASLSRLDEYRRAGATADQLSNPLLMGSLLVPLGLPPRRARAATPVAVDAAVDPDPGVVPGAPEAALPEEPDDVEQEGTPLAAEEDEEPEPGVDARALMLPFARRDLERLRLVLTAQRRLRDVAAPASARRALAARNYFEEAVRWLEIHGGPEGHAAVAHWSELDVEPHAGAPSPRPAREATAPQEGEAARRRRRRRRRRRPPSEPATPA